MKLTFGILAKELSQRFGSAFSENILDFAVFALRMERKLPLQRISFVMLR